MTNAELLAKLKAEIERLKPKLRKIGGKDATMTTDQVRNKFNALLSFLSTLESEKPMNQEGLEEEYKDYVENDPVYSKLVNRNAGLGIARHFYELGCTRTAEKFDDIEYNRQRAEESVPNDLEEAAEEYSKDYESGPNRIAINAFIAGAKWQAEQDTRDMYMSDNRHFQKVYELGKKDMKEQMMKEAVEGEITKDNRGNNVVRSGVFNNGFEMGDKVRIIIVKE